MKFFDVQQGSPEWFALRKGVLTASRAGKLITPKTGKLSAQAGDLLCEIIAERFSTIPPEYEARHDSPAIRWGVECEAEARRYFSFETGLSVGNGGFCLSDCGRYGSSPDALSDEAAVEIKCPTGRTQVRYVLDGTLPDDYRAQCHMHLLVTGRPVCWFLSYSPGLPALLLKVVPDSYTDALAACLGEFSARLAAALERFTTEAA